MSLIAPPPPPPVIALRDGDGARRLRFRLWQLLTTSFTVLVTAWFCTLSLGAWPWSASGVLTAIVALMIAKHVLVAILIVGLDQPEPKEVET
jgi:hypothetical protein